MGTDGPTIDAEARSKRGKKRLNARWREGSRVCDRDAPEIGRENGGQGWD